MANLDSALREAGKTIIKTFGTDVTFRRVLVGEYNTTTRQPVRTEIDKTIKGRLDEYRQHELGEFIQVGDRKLTVAASDLSFEPSSEDEVLISNKKYRVVDVKSPQATDQAAVHICQIRGAK
jgi:hypothetical protein